MSQAEFDAYVDDYDAQHAASIRLSGEAPDFFAEYKAIAAARALAAEGLSPRVIMDFGAGAGNSVAPLQQHFPEAALTAVDVSAASLARCRSRALRPIETVCYDGERLPFEAGSFDMGYWIERNFSDDEDRSICALNSTPLRAELHGDAVLSALHRAAVQWRHVRFATLMQAEPWRAFFGRLLMAPPSRVLSAHDAQQITRHGIGLNS